MSNIIGTFAYPGSGQDVFAAELVKRFNIAFYSMGDAIRDIARERELPLTRENLQTIRQELDRNHERTYLPKRLSARILEAKSDAIITGIRTREEYETFRNGFDFYLIFVYADKAVRYERLLLRAEAKDPLNYQEFEKQSDREAKLFDLAYLETVYDYKLDCNMPLEIFYAEFDSLIAQIDIIQKLKKRA